MFDVSKIARPCIQRQKGYVPGKPIEEVKREFGLTDVVKLASNENPLGVSTKALEAMIQEIRCNANYYPESSCHDLVERLAEIHHVSPRQIYIDNGLDGVITMLGMAFINPGDEVIIGSLTFPAYANITAKMDGQLVAVPLTKDYRHDIEAMIAAITPKTKIMFLCNPNNPTGTMITKTEFERVLAAVPETILVVSDEAYYDFVEDPRYPQTIQYMEDHPNLIVLRTFSKVMGMAGLRIGYALAHPDVIEVVFKVREPFPVNRIAQAGALASLDDAEFREQSICANKAGREQFYRAFAALGLDYCPSQTNFILVDLKQPSTPVYEAMLREGVIVRPLAPQGMPTGLRITVGTAAQNERCIRTLAKAMCIPVDERMM